MSKDNNSGELTLKENSVAKFRMNINADGYVFSTPVTVVDSIQINTFYWSLTTKSSFPN